MNEYEQYLPYIAVVEGKKRMLGSLQVYIRLLKKFELRQVVTGLVESIEKKSHNEVIRQSHAVKGTASNLSLIALYDIINELEGYAKDGQDVGHFVAALQTTMEETEKNIAALVEETE